MSAVHRPVGQGAYSAVDTGSTGGRATPAAKGRAVLLTVVEAALQVMPRVSHGNTCGPWSRS